MNELPNIKEQNEIYIKICSLEKEKDIWKHYDCKNNELELSTTKRFSSAMNIRYRNFRKEYIKRNDISCIWILVGIKNNEDTESWIQIGRSKHLTNLLSEDVKEDIKAILDERNGKYKDLKKEFKNLVFYEVNIEEFLKNDNDEALNGYRIEPQNENLKYVYHYIRAAYTEAKLGYYSDAQLFHTSTVDGFYYKYFKDKNKDIK